MQTLKGIKKRWSKQEDNFLRTNYSRVPVSTLAQQLRRSKKATRTRLERLCCKLSTLPRNKPKPKIKRRKYKGYHYDSNGVRFISVKGRGSVAEHRYLVEKKLGRKLSSREQVHHINCNKRDNRIENFYLSDNASKHRKCHTSLEKLTEKLMERNFIQFNTNKGEYEICKNQH